MKVGNIMSMRKYVWYFMKRKVLEKNQYFCLISILYLNINDITIKNAVNMKVIYSTISISFQNISICKRGV